VSRISKKVFVIGLDGASWKLIDPLLARGELPNLKKLVENGSRGILNSTILPLSPAAWTSFATGVRPEKHGILDFAHREEGTYEPVPYISRDRRSDPLWDILRGYDKRSIIINLPLTYPVDTLDGIMVSGFPTPEELGDFTYPGRILGELRREISNDFRLQPTVSAQDEKEFLGEMDVVTDFTYEATNYLMKKYPWDLLVSVFVGPDALGHVFYKYMDGKHPGNRKKAPDEYRAAISNMYRRIDGHIGKLLDNLDDDTAVIMVSDHGFGPMYYGVSINTWLHDEGFLALKRGLPTRFRYLLFSMGINYSNLAAMIKRLGLSKRVVKEAYRKKKSRLAALVNKFFLTNDDIDWRRTRLYSMGNIGQVFVNLLGREPEGMITKGREYEKVMDEFLERIKTLADPKTGERIFDRVLTKDEAFSTDPYDNLPDVIFFNTKMKYSINRFFAFGSKKLISPHPIWSGTHTHDGIFLAYYPGMIRGGKTIRDASICDPAATILHMMGLDVPGGMDGRVLLEVFEKDSEPGKRKIEYGDAQNEMRSKIGDLVRKKKL